MQYVESVSTTVAKWMKDVPHLPKGFTKWLAENSWWLTIVGVVISVFGVFGLLAAMTAGSALLVVVGAPALGGMFFISSLVSLVGIGISVVAEVMAITPLKAMKKRGWDLMFFVLLVSVAMGILGSLLTANVGGILFGIIGAAIGAYVILELKHYFVK
jgi:hypothetical protein